MQHQKLEQLADLLSEQLGDKNAMALATRVEEEIDGTTFTGLTQLLQPQTSNEILFLQIKLWSLVLVHMFVVVSNFLAFFTLPFLYPLYVWMPINSFLLTLMQKNVVCPLTEIENELRSQLGYPQIHGFIGTYFIRPVRRLYRILLNAYRSKYNR